MPYILLWEPIRATLIKIDSSKIIKPFYEETNNPPSTKDYLPLTVFDIVNYNTQVAVLFAYRPPTPPNEELELGLGKALSIYRVKFNVASVEASLDKETIISWSLTPSLRNFHAPTQGAEELVQVQLTRFSCGSLIVGFVAHHLIGDGQATSNFLVAWGRATRGVAIHPMPFLDRSIFTPREPPLFDQFEHRGVEYMKKKAKIHSSINSSISGNQDEIQVFKVHYTRDFLAKIKAEASSQKLKVDGDNRPYSTFESLLAHAWRTITKARGLDEDEKTHVRISVNGRMRLTPNVPNYFGNLVLWAFPTSKSKDLIEEPLAHAAKVIHESVAKINDDYFKSFIDFASFKVKEEELVPTADVTKPVLCPNVNVDSWLRFEFCDLDFGTGCPFAFVPSYIPVDGLIFLLPTSREDGSVDVIVSLFKDKLEEFKKICYCLE
ncbi:hypothetical protein Leryth_026019 [Lithospermum erythrorhizon]|nr:hypothetical protein Leryth_026019 [Lithospermum erythrorhizon]